MGDEGEIWSRAREAEKKRKQKNRDIFNKISVWELEDLEAEIEQITEYQFRVRVQGFIIDIYPTSGRYEE